MNLYDFDREIEYKGTCYYVLEILHLNMLLVVEKKGLEEGVFPIQTHIIPAK